MHIVQAELIWTGFGLLEFNVSLSQQRTYRDNASPRNQSLYCPDQDSIPVSQDTMIDEQSSASGQDYASDRSAIGAGWLELGQSDTGDNEVKLMMKHAPEWVRTSDSVIRNPACYL